MFATLQEFFAAIPHDPLQHAKAQAARRPKSGQNRGHPRRAIEISERRILELGSASGNVPLGLQLRAKCPQSPRC